MQETVVRPTTKFIRFGYLAVIVLIVGSAIAQTQIKDWPQNVPKWVLPAACALLLLWPISRHIEQRFTVMTIAGDKLRYETGMLSKATRTIQLSKVQDVTVRQTLAQRMGGVGDLSIETAGETSRLTFHNIDGPQPVADQIIDASHRIGVRGIMDDGQEIKRQGGIDNGGKQGPGQSYGSGAGGVGR